ncbi:MAG: hypothetical protein LBE35_01770 [Clostridiales bacterium]|jgi:hypothetical protein|nr:hypothetical protein [Clostridiales bacterium]
MITEKERAVDTLIKFSRTVEEANKYIENGLGYAPNDYEAKAGFLNRVIGIHVVACSGDNKKEPEELLQGDYYAMLNSAIDKY